MLKILLVEGMALMQIWRLSMEAPRDGNSPFLTCILFKGKWTPAPF